MKFTLFLGLLITISAFASRVNTKQGNPSKNLKYGYVPNNIHVPIEWEAYIDDSTDTFWTEGNHIPDRGLLNILKKKIPTLNDVKLWLLRQERKAEKAQMLLPLIAQAQQELIQGGYMKDRYGVMKKPIYLPNLKDNKPTLNHTPILKSLDFYFLFKKDCSMCKRLASTLKGFPNVTPLQVGGDTKHNFQGLPKTEFADMNTIKTYVKKGTIGGVLVIHDPKGGNVNILSGEPKSNEIIMAAAKLINARGTK